MISDTAERLRLAALAQWRMTGLPDPGVSHVVTGEVAIDDCCDGLLVVSIDQLVWWNPFPFEGLLRAGASGVVIPFMDGGKCLGTLGAAVTIHVGLCVPVINELGDPPPADAVSAAMGLLVDVAQTITTGIACVDEDCWVVGGVTFAGPEGGCLLAQISGRVDNCAS